MKHGYTLVELLISIAILALLLSVGTVSFRDFTRRQLVIGAVRQVKSDLRLAQTEALAGKKPAGCTGILRGYRFLRSSNTQYTIQADCSGAATPITIRNVNMPANTTIDVFSPNPPGGYIGFKSVAIGTTLTSNVTMMIRGSGTNYSQGITVNIAGDIQ